MVYFNWNICRSFSCHLVHNFYLMLSNNKFILISILTFSIISLSIAYYVEYILGHSPCNLCLIERIPYIVLIILISLILIINRYEILISSIILVSIFFGLLISIYHLGIEQGLFDESQVCKLNEIGANTTSEDLLKDLKSAPISCKEVTFHFFGLSLVSLNILASLFIGFAMIKVLINFSNNKKNNINE